MLGQLVKFLRLSCALLIFLMLAGCAGTSVVSKSESLIPTYKLNFIQVTWIDNYSMPYETSMLLQRYVSAKPLTDADKAFILAPYKAESHQVMGQLVSFFGEQVVPKVRGQLARNNVHDGNDISLELFPVSVHHAVNGGRRIHVRASLKQRHDSRVVWSVTIEAHGPKEDKNEVLLDNFVSALMDELKKAGWLSA